MSTVFPNITITDHLLGDGTNQRAPVRAATTAAGTLASSFANGSSIDGVTLATDDRILIKDQTSAIENGLYIVQASGAPVRDIDLETGDSANGFTVFVKEGTANGINSFTCNSAAGSDVADTNTLSWTKSSFSGTLGVEDGGTGLSSITANEILFGSATDTIGQISGANSSVLVTNGSGVPSLSTTLPDGLTANALASFSINDATTTAFDLAMVADSDGTAMTADRTLTYDVNNADRTIDLSGDLTLAGNFSTSGANDVTLTSTGSTNVTLPTTGTLANQAYVDSVVSGLDWKNSVRLGTTVDLDSNGSISGTITYNSTGGTSTRGQITATLAVSDTFTIDGVSIGAAEDGTRILLKDQSSGAQNGIWTSTISGTSLTLDRATDFDEDDEVTANAAVFIEEGTACADCAYTLTTNDPITIGGASGTALVFTQFSGTGTVIAGDGLDKVGNTLSVDLKANGGLVIESTELAVDLGASSITGTLAVGDGGTGITSLASNTLIYGSGGASFNTVAPAASSVLVSDGSSVPGWNTALPANLTIPTPLITTSIKDGNGNEIVNLSPAASAVNEFTIANAATGGDPTLSATGTDANIDMTFQAKGTGVYNFLATADASSEVRLFEDTTNGTAFVSFKALDDLSGVNRTYTWPSAVTADYILQTDASGTLTWTDPSTIKTKRDFPVLFNEVTATSTSPTTVTYMGWDGSEYDTYTTRRVTFYHETSTKTLTLDVYDGTGIVGTATTTASTSGIQTFTFTDPAGTDSRLEFRVSASSPGTPRPKVFSIVVTLL